MTATKRSAPSTTTFTTRVPHPLRASIEAAAREAGTTRNEWVVAALSRALGNEEVVRAAPVRSEAEVDEMVTGVKDDHAADLDTRRRQRACEHPRAERDVKTWGTVCGACGKVNP